MFIVDLNFEQNLSDRIQVRLQEVVAATVAAASKGEVIYARLGDLGSILKSEEVDLIFSALPCVVLVTDEVRTITAQDYMSIAGELTPEAHEYLQNGLKYTPVRAYKIIGNEADLLENMFRYIVNDERDNNSAIIEISARLDGASNNFVMFPWGNELHTAFDASGHSSVKMRRNREAGWEAVFET